MARYDNSEKFFNKGLTSIGTSYLPTFKESNSDILLIATQGDRCDLIANEYYGTTELWWYVASVNNLSSNNIEAGTQLRVPVSTEQAIVR
tara:strand:+ start:421 stop:690 length:270 start_codon:yes stop_codon:yes gene_type:complete